MNMKSGRSGNVSCKKDKDIAGFIVDWNDINSSLNTFFFHKDNIINNLIFYSEETDGVCKGILLDSE